MNNLYINQFNKYNNDASIYVSNTWESNDIKQLQSIEIIKSKIFIGEPYYPNDKESVDALPGRWITRIRPCTETVIHIHEAFCFTKNINTLKWIAMIVGGRSCLGISDRIYHYKTLDKLPKIDLELDGPYSLDYTYSPNMIAIDAGEMRGRLALIGLYDNKAVAVVYPSLLNNRVLDN